MSKYDDREDMQLEKNNIGMPLFGGLLAAIIGGVVWALIAITTSYELGIIAWGVGGLAGFIVAITAAKRINPVHQIIAVVASLLGILLGKYLLFSYYFNGETLDGLFDSEVITTFQENLQAMFQGIDIVFVVLAVLTAWQLPKKLAKSAGETPEQPVSPS
jgi:chromate transport protein ChrA